MRSIRDAGPLPAAATAPAQHPRPTIVAIGVGADGHDALHCLLADLAPAAGVVYALAFDGAAPVPDVEQLQRRCPLPLCRLADGQPLPDGHVLLLPDGAGIGADGDRLHCVGGADGQRATPLDRLLRSAAHCAGDAAIGVLLGARSDGLLGLRAVREVAGLTVLDRAPDCPEAAAGGDLVLAPEQLGRRLAEHLRSRRHPAPLGAGNRGALEQILLLLHAHTGHDFSAYKRTSLGRRIERRMAVHQLERYGDYVAYLRENPRELSLLFKELLIGVTRFFRDAEAWDALDRALPELLEQLPEERPLRAWVAGCSTGEEAYTLAMLLQEALLARADGPRRSVQVFASDLDGDAIERARAGWFPAGIAADVDPARLARWFTAERDGYRINRELRELVVFAPHNVFMDPPFTRLDLLLCRNLLIYLEPTLQRKLFPLFQYCLNPGGLLLLGSAETVGRQPELFVSVDAKARLYRRIEQRERVDGLEFPARLLPAVGTERPRPAGSNLQQLAEQLLLQQFAPAAALVNGQGDILFINGRTGRFLEPAAGRANWNIYAMARRGLGQELAIALPRALRERCRVDCHGVGIDGEAGPLAVDLSVIGISEPEPLEGMALVTFADGRCDGREREPAQAGDPALQRALEQARDVIRTTREEMQSQQEELRSANEELQSTNEELQSANEELTTSKEEMQAMNEELQSLNSELQARLDQLSRAHSDVDNLLIAADLAVVFLDAALRVRRYAGAAEQLFKLMPGDIGRPIDDLASELVHIDLPAEAREVLRTLMACDRAVGTRNGRRLRLRITPYRTEQQVIDGVVVTLTDLEHALALAGRDASA